MANLKLKAVILAGGIGSRLWPLSRELYPKHLLQLTGSRSLFQITVLRAVSVGMTEILVVAAHTHRFYIQEQIDELQLSDNIAITILLEPQGKNTAAAIALAAMACHREDVLWVMPADHVLNDENLRDELLVAQRLSLQSMLVTFGVSPTSPETGYGYIQRGQACQNGHAFVVNEFKEKPNIDLAKQYYSSGEYFWNSGMYCFCARVILNELQRYHPTIIDICQKTYEGRYNDLGFIKFPEDVFSLCPKSSIDYAVMEKTTQARVVPLSGFWSDVGAWGSLYQLEDKDESGNVVNGDVVIENVRNSMIKSTSRLVAVAGLEDVIVVETADAVLVTDRGNDQMVKALVTQLKKDQREERAQPNRVLRPWGSYQVLNRTHQYEVRLVRVNPGASIMPHQHPAVQKQWLLINGSGEALLRNQWQALSNSSAVAIAPDCLNGVRNNGDMVLEFIEIRLVSKVKITTGSA